MCKRKAHMKGFVSVHLQEKHLKRAQDTEAEGRQLPERAGAPIESMLLYVQPHLPSLRPTSCTLQTTSRLWSYTEFKSWLPLFLAV